MVGGGEVDEQRRKMKEMVVVEGASVVKAFVEGFSLARPTWAMQFEDSGNSCFSHRSLGHCITGFCLSE